MYFIYLEEKKSVVFFNLFQSPIINIGMGPKVILNNEQIQHIHKCFDHVAKVKGKFTVDVIKMFNDTYPNLKVSYRTLKFYHDKHIATMSLKRELSDLSKDKGNSSKLVRDFSSLSMEINSDHMLEDFYNDTLYSDRFIAFLCNNATKLAFAYNLEFTEFLKLNSLKEIIIPGDGLCFISCVRLYLNEFHGINISVEEISHLTHQFYLNNIIPIHTQDQTYDIFLENCIQQYFVDCIYDSDFVDQFITDASNIINTSICILDKRENSMVIYILKPRELENDNQNFISNMLVVSRHGLHFNLIIPANYEIPNFSIGLIFQGLFFE